MKAEIISEYVFEGLMGAMHGMGFPIRRLFIKEKNNLAITIPDRRAESIIVMEGYEPHPKSIVVGTVDVPDEIVEQALLYIQAKKELEKHSEKIAAIIDDSFPNGPTAERYSPFDPSNTRPLTEKEQQLVEQNLEKAKQIVQTRKSKRSFWGRCKAFWYSLTSEP